jgi:hypothetical protein
MRIVALMIFPAEVKKAEFFCSLRLDLPKQEGPNWETLHETVEQFADLIWIPHKFALDGG